MTPKQQNNFEQKKLRSPIGNLIKFLLKNIIQKINLSGFYVVVF
jgi:hypothetical protein